MMLIEIPPLLATSLAGEVISTFETMPFVPGKIAFYLLVFLSILSWSIILSKSLLISRIRHADKNFKNRLKQSGTCLEVFEQGENYEPSLFFEVYKEGARAASIELIGASNSGLFGEKKEESRIGLSRNQLKVIEAGLEYGESFGAGRLRGGFACLRIIATIAPLIGVIAACWVLGTALSAEGVSFRLLLNSAAFLAVTTLFVSAPAGIGRVYFMNQCRRQAKKTRHFRNRIQRVFADTFAKPEAVAEVASAVDFDSPFILDDEATESGAPILIIQK